MNNDEKKKSELRRRAYVEAIKELQAIQIATEDLTEGEDEEVQRIVRDDLTAVLDRARTDEATGRTRK